MEGSFQRPARPDPVPAHINGNFEVSPKHKDQPRTPLAWLAWGQQMALSRFIWPCHDPTSAQLSSPNLSENHRERDPAWATGDEVRRAGNGEQKVIFQTRKVHVCKLLAGLSQQIK